MDLGNKNEHISKIQNKIQGNRKSPSPKQERNSVTKQEARASIAVQGLNPWEIDNLIYMNRLLPQYQNIVNRGQIMEKERYKIFISYKIQCTLSNIYYCQEFDHLKKGEEQEKNHFKKQISSVNVDNAKENEQLQFIPKVMRITPKLYQNQPIEGLYKSEYIKKVFSNACCRYQHMKNFVRYFDLFEDESNIYTVTEQYESNLREFLMKNYQPQDLIPEEIVLDFLFQIYLGMHYLQENKLKIVQSLKLTSILVDSKKKLKVPVFSYSTYNLNPKSMPPSSMKYLAPEIISSNYNIEPSNYQSSWTLGILLLDILQKGYQNGPLDLQASEQTYSAKVQKNILTNKILTFNIDKYIEKNSVFFSNYSPQFIDFIKHLLCSQVAGRIKINQVKNHPFYQNIFSMNKFYNSRKINVSLSDYKEEKRIPFSMKEILFD